MSLNKSTLSTFGKSGAKSHSIFYALLSIFFYVAQDFAPLFTTSYEKWILCCARFCSTFIKSGNPPSSHLFPGLSLPYPYHLPLIIA